MTRLHYALFAAMLVALVAWGATVEAATQSAVTPLAPTITPIRGDLYLARFDWRATVFLVTPDGIIMGDPISEAAARWLREQLAIRFPEQRLRYVLQSHHHFDRASGASVFEAAETIGHRLFNTELRDARREPLYAGVQPVKRTFDERERVTLGGRTVEIIHTGPGHTPDMSILYFPDERVVFAVDPPAVEALPFAFRSDYTPHELAIWLAAVSPLPFDLLVTGDGGTIDPAPARLLKPYLDDLIAAVTAGVSDGRTLSQLRAEVLLPAHAGNGHYAARADHITRVYRGLSLRQWHLYAAAGANQVSRNAAYCVGYTSCDPFGGILPMGSLGLGYSIGRLGFVSEIGTGDQLLASRSSRFYDDLVVNRRTSVSSLLRFRLGNATGSRIDILAGLAWVSSDTQGLDRVKDVLAPIGGRHEIGERRITIAYAGGADVSLLAGRRWTVRAPVRFTIGEEAELHPGRHDVQVGLGLAYRVAHRVAVQPGRPQPVAMRRTQP